MLSPVIKVVDPQADFRPIKYSEQTTKMFSPDAALILKAMANVQKERKQEEIRKCAKNWCLK